MHTDLWQAPASAWQAALERYPEAIRRYTDEKVAAGKGVVARLPGHDTWYREEFTPAVVARSPMTLTADELVRVTEWKMARGAWRAPNLVRVKKNSEDAVHAAGLEAAAQLDHVAKAINALTVLDGVGPATASAVLAVMRPTAYPFFDEDVAASIAALGPVAWTLAYYKGYASALIEQAVRLGPEWNAVMAERALWSAIKLPQP